MPLQWRNQIWQSLEEGAGKRCLVSNSKHWFTTSFLQPLPYLVTPSGRENGQLMSSFFVGAQTVVNLLQTAHIKQGVPFITTNKVYTTLRASLSGTFLQTLPDLVTPLKGRSLSPRSCPPTRSAPSERFGY